MFLKNSEIIVQTNDAGLVLLDMNCGEFYSLYDVAAYIWGCVEEELSQEIIVEKVSEEYGISKDDAFIDVDAFLKELCEANIIFKNS